MRTRVGARPLAVHAAWGTSPEAAVEVVLAATGRARTPEPLRAARAAARRARARRGCLPPEAAPDRAGAGTRPARRRW